ncbi:nuclear speckle splicing regulatory protein 1 [Lucilia cuprina]|uniref:nuclear speckle splicing regulatory protein 1 n=1 Tax=Lucilia cuprina TaxID=7375 RepID=UPI001F068D41|nr:nuclear speckle splicing regulatory protein 1 [Lucilia cuprina]
MSKQYGLILPGQQKKQPTREVSREFTKPSIFDESSSESDENGPPQMQMKKAPIGPSLMEKRKAKNLQEKALAEDPTIFQYDELYDEMENKREEEKQVKSNEPKKARYITKLMETAERRKLENELRVERQVQKEREAEGEEFKDKEKFVTSAYRKKLEEMRKLEEQNKRDDYLEAIGDVTKQKDLDGFYRHLYEQKMGTSKEVKKPELKPEVTNAGDSDEEGVSYKPIKSGKPTQSRAYRKRQASDEEEETEKDTSIKEETEKKVHLTNNIDADSDFSIDDSSSSEDDSDNEGDSKKKKAKITKDFTTPEDSQISKTPSNSMALNLKSLKPEEQKDSQIEKPKKEEEKPLPIPSVEIAKENLPPPKPKRDKAEVWRKRTVGEVYVAAVQRYYERKAARNQA